VTHEDTDADDEPLLDDGDEEMLLALLDPLAGDLLKAAPNAEYGKISLVVSLPYEMWAVSTERERTNNEQRT
jgi:hypothetical protein